MDTIAELKIRRDELQRQLSDPGVLRDAQKIKKLSIEYGRVEKELRDLARQTFVTTSSESGQRQKAIVEIRAGAGGEEAALFARELLDMYSSFAKKRGWQVEIINSHPTSLNGIKEAVLEIAGTSAYDEIRHEGGVHRVQRIPGTEKSGRIHTSTASVAILKEAEEKDMEIKPQDIKVEFFRSSGPGGQNVNKVETAVRVYHLPSGLVTSSQDSRSQQKNREQALMLLRTKLLEAEREAEENKSSQARREQIGRADRSEKVRTYNFPQDRVTDHRTKQSWHNIEKILAGELDSIIEATQKIVPPS